MEKPLDLRIQKTYKALIDAFLQLLQILLLLGICLGIVIGSIINTVPELCAAVVCGTVGRATRDQGKKGCH